MRNVSEKVCRETSNEHFVFSNFISENRAAFEIMQKKKNGQVRHVADDSIIRGIQFAC